MEGDQLQKELVQLEALSSSFAAAAATTALLQNEIQSACSRARL